MVARVAGLREVPAMHRHYVLTAGIGGVYWHLHTGLGWVPEKNGPGGLGPQQVAGLSKLGHHMLGP